MERSALRGSLAVGLFRLPSKFRRTPRHLSASRTHNSQIFANQASRSPTRTGLAIRGRMATQSYSRRDRELTALAFHGARRTQRSWSVESESFLRGTRREDFGFEGGAGRSCT